MNSPTAIRLAITPDVARALKAAKRRYPALSDSMILEVGLSQLPAVMSDVADGTPEEVERTAVYSLNIDGYLEDPAEDVYHLGMGKPNNFRA